MKTMKHIITILTVLALTACTYDPFTTQLIQTTTPTKITAYSASIGGERLAISYLDEAGIVFAGHPNPGLNDYKVMCATVPKNFVADLCDLRSGTVYYARAYITNKYITVYGNTVIFKTLSPP